MLKYIWTPVFNVSFDHGFMKVNNLTLPDFSDEGTEDGNLYVAKTFAWFKSVRI